MNDFKVGDMVTHEGEVWTIGYIGKHIMWLDSLCGHHSRGYYVGKSCDNIKLYKFTDKWREKRLK